METIVIDGERMPDRQAAHNYLAERLSLPDYYGRNLDALYDLLTGRGDPVRLVVRHRAALLSRLGEYGASLCRTLEEAALDNPALEVQFLKD